MQPAPQEEEARWREEQAKLRAEEEAHWQAWLQSFGLGEFWLIQSHGEFWLIVLEGVRLLVFGVGMRGPGGLQAGVRDSRYLLLKSVRPCRRAKKRLAGRQNDSREPQITGQGPNASRKIWVSYACARALQHARNGG